MKFSKIYGHGFVLKRLSEMLEVKGIPDVTLFHGPPAVGKHTIAAEFSRYALCVGTGADDCHCKSCVTDPVHHPDFLEIGVSEAIKVNDIEPILDFASKAPFLSNRKVVLLDNCHTMTELAANRILKVLESPVEGLLFLLVTSNPEQILPTILSRCQQVQFGSLDAQDAMNVAMKRLGYDPPKARVIGWLAADSSTNVFSKAGLYLSMRDVAMDLLSKIKSMGMDDLFDFVDKIDRESIIIFVDMLVMLLTDMLLIHNGVGDIVNADLRESLTPMTKVFKDKPLAASAGIINQVKRSHSVHANTHTALKVALMRCSRMLVL